MNTCITVFIDENRFFRFYRRKGKYQWEWTDLDGIKHAAGRFTEDQIRQMVQDENPGVQIKVSYLPRKETMTDDQVRDLFRRIIKRIDDLDARMNMTTPQQDARREWCVYLSANKPSALYITDGKWPFAGVEAFKVRETRPTDREVWMRPLYSPGTPRLRMVDGDDPVWVECSPDDEGAVRCWMEGETW